MNVEKGVTKMGNKTFVKPKPVWWIPPEVNEIFAMKAIQKSMEERHKANKECEEKLTNAEETGNFTDPSVPDEVHMDNDSPNTEWIVYLELEEWQKSHETPAKKPQKKRPMPQNSATPQTPKSFSIKDPKTRKLGQQKGNPIPIPADCPQQDMETDFTAS
ncbi:hypothetical protein DSO57_1018843 [Entomophthora muscae]|uniref:Uncharacterized protein n=1 Tax=Entomophthora muscae TaxID=34485 RepID=A0ACC2UE05_9FUNG|nr:hypothetical protein DSO57_1018843 [Entomophthora muscae]